MSHDTLTDEALKALGFASRSELLTMVARVPLDTPVGVAAYETWRTSDRSRAGLERLLAGAPQRRLGPAVDFRGPAWTEGEHKKYEARRAACELKLDLARLLFRRAAMVSESCLALCEWNPADYALAAWETVTRRAHARDFAVAVAIADRCLAAPDALSPSDRERLAALRDQYARAAAWPPIEAEERTYRVRAPVRTDAPEWTTRVWYFHGFWTTDPCLGFMQRHPDPEAAVRAHNNAWAPLTLEVIGGPPAPPTPPEAAPSELANRAAALALAVERFDRDRTTEHLAALERAWRLYRVEASEEVLVMTLWVELREATPTHAAGARGHLVPCASAPGTLAVAFDGESERYVDVPTHLLRRVQPS